jgi:DNA-binding CsgD family transcriptional regulator
VRTALTAREAEVLRSLADGLSNTEIARRLFISDATVKTHVAQIIAKLEVRDRLQAVIAAYRLGLVEVGGPGRKTLTAAPIQWQAARTRPPRTRLTRCRAQRRVR